MERKVAKDALQLFTNNVNSMDSGELTLNCNLFDLMVTIQKYVSVKVIYNLKYVDVR